MKAYLLRAGVGLAGLLVAAATPGLAQSGPAFDCSKAEGEIEVLICQDDELAARDRKLAEVYKQALAAIEDKDNGWEPEAVSYLRTFQRGWIGGRNECWKAADKRDCALDLYDRRIAEIQAKYFLVEGGAPVFYTCNNNPSDEIVATFIPTDPPSVRLERGDTTKVAVVSPLEPGSNRYHADFGIYFAVDGDTAQVAWPQEKEFNCTVRK